MPEAQLQRHVEAAAKQLGFRVYHTWNSMRSSPGFPDLVAIKDGRMIVAELKRDGKEPTKTQRDWLDAFAEVPGVEVYLWFSSEWEDGTIVDVLTRREAD